jgi:hypothetical protein
VSCTKQKDAAPFKPIEVKLKIITIPPAVEGEEVSDSCVVVGAQEERSLTLLALLGTDVLHYSELMSRGQSQGISKSTLDRALRDTIKNNKILKENGLYRVRSL